MSLTVSACWQFETVRMKHHYRHPVECILCIRQIFLNYYVGKLEMSSWSNTDSIIIKVPEESLYVVISSHYVNTCIIVSRQRNISHGVRVNFDGEMKT